MRPAALGLLLALWAQWQVPAIAGAEPPSSRPSSQPSSRPTTSPSSRPTENDEDKNQGDDLAEIERALAADHAAAAKKPQGDGAASAPRSALARAASRTFQSLNPDLSFIADFALAYFSSDGDPPMVGGHDPSKNGFNLQQLELAVSASVDAYFRFDANIVFSQFGVEVEEVYGTTLGLPLNLQLRAGQFLTRFGRINATHPHSWSFVDQALVIGKHFGGEGNRGLGVELSLLMPLPWYVELVASATEAAGGSTARSFFGDEDLGVEGLDDLQYTVALKQFFPLSDNWSLSWGISGAFGPNSSGRDNHTDIFGSDLYLKYRPITHGSYTIVSLDVEWLLRRRQVPLDVLQDHGLYAYLFWRFSKRWAAAARYEYVTGVSDDPLDPQWTETRQRASANLTFWPTEFSRLRLQYAHDRPGWIDPYHAVMLAMELSVGAHGAHKF